MQARLIQFCVVAIIAVIPGCGAGSRGLSGSPTMGRATFTVIWPGQKRLIPNASSSIVIQITNSGTVVASQTLARPSGGGTTSASFPALPIGQLSATATAYPQLDGTGVAQADATVPIVTQANKTTNITISMVSTIDHIELSPSPATVQVGKSLDLSATAKDAAGEVVSIVITNLTWGLINSPIAAVNSQGQVSGLQAGTINITVTDSESGKSAFTVLTVVDQTYVIGGVTYGPSNPREISMFRLLRLTRLSVCHHIMDMCCSM